MASCWSCTVLIEEGSKICPFCGADQTQPVHYVNPHLPQPESFRSKWGLPILIVIAAAAIISTILWLNFGEPRISPDAQATSIAAQSLREVRESLSTYALSAKDSYPAALTSLGERVDSSLQAAQGAGYRLEYAPKPSPADIAPRGFEILAVPAKAGYPNLFIDESGVVRATSDNRPATANDPPL